MCGGVLGAGGYSLGRDQGHQKAHEQREQVLMTGADSMRSEAIMSVVLCRGC